MHKDKLNWVGTWQWLDIFYWYCESNYCSWLKGIWNIKHLRDEILRRNIFSNTLCTHAETPLTGGRVAETFTLTLTMNKRFFDVSNMFNVFSFMTCLRHLLLSLRTFFTNQILFCCIEETWTFLTITRGLTITISFYFHLMKSSRVPRCLLDE